MLLSEVEPTEELEPASVAEPEPTAEPEATPEAEPRRLYRMPFVEGAEYRFGVRGFGVRRHPIHGDYRMHSGMDFGVKPGTPVGAARDGVVVDAGWRGGYGMMVTIEHHGDDGKPTHRTRYAHLSSMTVSSGTPIEQGQHV